MVNGNKGKLRCIERSQYPIFGVIFSAYKIEYPKVRKDRGKCIKEAFVGENDVVSEQLPEPLASVSSRKLRQESDHDDLDPLRVIV